MSLSCTGVPMGSGEIPETPTEITTSRGALATQLEPVGPGGSITPFPVGPVGPVVLVGPPLRSTFFNAAFSSPLAGCFHVLYRRQGFQPATQIVVEYQCAPAALDGAERAGPDGFIQGCSSGTCDCARLRHTVSKRCSHCSLAAISRDGPGNHARVCANNGPSITARQAHVALFFSIFGPAGPMVASERQCLLTARSKEIRL
jgi:hypothetical protein